MSFSSLLRHTVVVKRRFAVLDGAGDPTYTELGQPITELLPLTTWRCRIEPLTAEEVALLSQAGAAISTHRIYGYPGTVKAADQLVEGTRVFEVQGTPADAGGAGHHVELLALYVASEEPERS